MHMEGISIWLLIVINHTWHFSVFCKIFLLFKNQIICKHLCSYFSIQFHRFSRATLLNLTFDPPRLKSTSKLTLLNTIVQWHCDLYNGKVFDYQLGPDSFFAVSKFPFLSWVAFFTTNAYFHQLLQGIFFKLSICC